MEQLLRPLLSIARREIDRGRRVRVGGPGGWQRHTALCGRLGPPTRSAGLGSNPVAVEGNKNPHHYPNVLAKGDKP